MADWLEVWAVTGVTSLSRQDLTKAGNSGVVISRRSVGSPCVKMKIRVMVVRYNFLISEASDFLRLSIKLLAQGSEVARAAEPPWSMTVLMMMTADNRPAADLS
jgi:hypothetical protein